MDTQCTINADIIIIIQKPSWSINFGSQDEVSFTWEPEIISYTWRVRQTYKLLGSRRLYHILG